VEPKVENAETANISDAATASRARTRILPGVPDMARRNEVEASPSRPATVGAFADGVMALGAPVCGAAVCGAPVGGAAVG
jgi:hypothetical protein